MRASHAAHVTLGLALLALLPPAAAAVQTFEGVIASTMRDEDENTSWEFTTSLKGTKARIESPSMDGAYQLVDVPAQVFIVVMPAERKYLKFELGGVADEEMPKGKLEPTGRTETIAGHSCTHYVYRDDEEGTLDVCAAKGLGFGLFGGAPGSGRQDASLPRDFHLAFKDGFQPLKVERVDGAKRELVMLVTSIARKTLAASLFDLPAGFQEIPMGLPGGPERP